MKVFELLLEEAEHTSKIEPEEAFSLIDAHCSKFASTMKHQRIFRGGAKLGGTNCYFGNSNIGGVRKSTTDLSDLITMWLDNHPDWEGFPKRAHSFIGASSFFVASSYGHTSLLIPYDDANVGIVPDEDIYGAFELQHLSDKEGSFSLFDKVLEIVRKKHGGQKATTFKDLVRQLKLADLQLLQEHASDELVKNAINSMKTIKANTFYDVVRDVFSPRNFTHDKASNIKLQKSSEVYVQGKCVFIPFILIKGGERPSYSKKYQELFNAASDKYDWGLNLYTGIKDTRKYDVPIEKAQKNELDDYDMSFDHEPSDFKINDSALIYTDGFRAGKVVEIVKKGEKVPVIKDYNDEPAKLKAPHFATAPGEETKSNLLFVKIDNRVHKIFLNGNAKVGKLKGNK